MNGGKLYRAEDWWVGKVSMLMGLLYFFSIRFLIHFDTFALYSLGSLITIIGFASFGYLVNDYYDLQKDRLVGKKNFLIGKSINQRIVFGLVSAAILIMPWMFLPSDSISYLLIFVQLLLYIIYSAPPIRLKEKGLLGVISDALYAHAVPSILAAYTYTLIARQKPSALFLFILFFWQFSVGVRNVLLHQLKDHQKDIESGTDTFLISSRLKFNKSIFSKLNIPELVFLLTLLSLCAIQNQLFIIPILAVFISGLHFIMMDRTSGYRFHYPNLLYEQWLPYSFILILSLTDYRYTL